MSQQSRKVRLLILGRRLLFFLSENATYYDHRIENVNTDLNLIINYVHCNLITVVLFLHSRGAINGGLTVP